METSPQLNEEEENFQLSEEHKTFFRTLQERGYPYFNNTRVGSCSYVLVKNGQCLAVPFFIIIWICISFNQFTFVLVK